MDGNRKEEAHFDLGYDWDKSVAFRPLVYIKVAKDYNSVLCSGWRTIFVSFDGRDGHCGEGITNQRTNGLVVFF